MIVLCFVAAGAVLAVDPNDPTPVQVSNISCETGAGVTCDATLHNTNNKTGYDLAVKVVGYDAGGDIVTSYVNDATGNSDGIASVPPGGSENISISVSGLDRVTAGDVRVVDTEPMGE